MSSASARRTEPVDRSGHAAAGQHPSCFRSHERAERRLAALARRAAGLDRLLLAGRRADIDRDLPRLWSRHRREMKRLASGRADPKRDRFNAAQARSGQEARRRDRRHLRGCHPVRAFPHGWKDEQGQDRRRSGDTEEKARPNHLRALQRELDRMFGQRRAWPFGSATVTFPLTSCGALVSTWAQAGNAAST